jgi:hypothetical protein
MDTGFIYKVLYIYITAYSMFTFKTITRKYSYHTGPNSMKKYSPLKARLGKEILCLFTDP